MLARLLHWQKSPVSGAFGTRGAFPRIRYLLKISFFLFSAYHKKFQQKEQERISKQMKPPSRRMQRSCVGTSQGSSSIAGPLDSSTPTTAAGTAPFSEIEEDTQTINQTFETIKRADDNIKDLYNWNATDDHERRSLPVFRDQKEVRYMKIDIEDD